MSTPVGGRARVLVFADGTYATGNEERSAGERHWSRPPRTWVDVDVTPHTLAAEIPFSDGGGRAGFVASVAVQCKVENALEVASLGIKSVGSYVEPALAEAVAQAGANVRVEADDPVSALAQARRGAEAAVREALSGEWGDAIAVWLYARVVSVSVRLDDDTERHRRDLVDRQRTTELIDADARIKAQETRYAIEERKRWRDELVPHLSNPALREFEAVLSDPTPENIAAVVHRVNQVDLADREAVFAVLQRMIDKDFLDKDTPMFNAAAEAIMNGLQRRPLGSGPTSIGSGEQQNQIEAPGIDAEPSEEQPGDRNWGER